MQRAPFGVIPAIPTPFTADARSVEEAALRRVVRHVLDGGVHGIMTTGGTGEFPHLSREERRLVTEVVAAEAGGEAKVFDGHSASSSRRSGSRRGAGGTSAPGSTASSTRRSASAQAGSSRLRRRSCRPRRC